MINWPEGGQQPVPGYGGGLVRKQFVSGQERDPASPSPTLHPNSIHLILIFCQVVIKEKISSVILTKYMFLCIIVFRHPAGKDGAGEVVARVSPPAMHPCSIALEDAGGDTRATNKDVGGTPAPRLSARTGGPRHAG